jgi:hypothetical protein
MADRHTKPETTNAVDGDRGLERAIVLQALRDDHAARWSPRELTAELTGEESAAVERALARLVRERVLERSNETIQASRPTRRLSELELIAI